MYEVNKKLISGGLAICLSLSPVIATAATQQQGATSIPGISNFDQFKNLELTADTTAESAAVNAINNATVEEMKDVIKDNASILGLKLTDYTALIDKDPVYLALFGKKFANKAAVKKAFDTAVATEKKAEATAVANALKAINSATVNGMGPAIIANASILGLDLTDYTNLESKSQVHKDLVGKRFTTIAAVQKAFDAAVAKEKALEAAPAEEAKAVIAINMADADSMGAVIEANATILGLVLTDYNGLYDKSPVYEALVGKSFADKTAVKKAFDAAVATEKVEEQTVLAQAIAAINKATVDTMGAAIEANANVLGLVLTDYDALTNKTPVHKALVGKRFKDKAAVKKAFDAAVAAEKKAEIAAAEKAAVAAINSATVETMGAAIEANATILGLVLTDYAALTDKTPVHKALVGKRFRDKVAVKKAFDAAVVAEKAAEAKAIAETAAVDAINHADTESMGAVITANATILGLVLTDYNGLWDKSPVYEALVGKNFANKAEVKTAFDEAVKAEKVEEQTVLAQAVAAINSATKDTMGAAIEANATVLGLVLTDYDALTNKTPVHKALVGKRFKDKAAVKKAFDAAVAAEKKAEIVAAEKAAVAAINSATVETMGAAIEANATILGLVLTDYAALTDKTPVHTALVGKRFRDKVAVKKAFDAAVAAEKAAEAKAIAEAAAVDAINHADTESMGAVITANATILGLVLTDYNGLWDKSPVYEALVGKSFANKAEVKTAFDAAVATEKAEEAKESAQAVEAINKATVDTMGAAIEANANVLGLVLTDYDALTNKTPVHKALVGKRFKDKAAVKKAFDTAVATEKKTEIAAAEKAAVEAINSATVETMGAAIEANAAVLGLVLTDYAALTDKTPVHTALVGKRFRDKVAVKKAFDVAVAAEKAKEANGILTAALAAINSATVETMGAAIEANAATLGLVLTDYNALKNKVPVHEALAGQGFVDAVGVQIVFNYAVAKEKKAEVSDIVAPEITEVSSISGAVLDKTLLTLTFPFSNLNRNSGIEVSKDSKMALTIEGVGRVGDFDLKAGQTNSFLNTLFSTNLDLPDAELTKIFNAMKTLDSESKRQILEAVNLTELFTLIQKSDPATIDAVFKDIDFVNTFAAVQTADLETKEKIFDNMIGVLDIALAENNSAFKGSLISALKLVFTNKDLTEEQIQAVSSYLNNGTGATNLIDLFRSFKLTKEQKNVILKDIDFTKVFDAVMSLQRTTRTSVFKAINFTDLFNVVKNSSSTIRDQFYKDVSEVIDTIVTSGIPRDKIFDTITFGEVNKIALFKLLNNLDGNLNDPEVKMTATLTDVVGNTNTYTFHILP